MNTDDKIKTLEQFAHAHYEAGGHWVFECYGRDDYIRVLDDANGDIDRAKQLIKEDWEFTNEREQECAWGAPDEPADPCEVGCEFDEKLTGVNK